MPRLRPLTHDEKLLRRYAVIDKAAAGTLRLPFAVKELRQALGMTQAMFADKFGLTRAQLVHIEKGVANPTLETLSKIGRPFGFVLGFVPAEKKES